MKNTLTLTLLLFSLIAHAQVEKGKFLLTGNIAYSRNSNDNGTPVSNTATAQSLNNITEIEFSPYVGYMISSRIAVGVFGGYRENRSERTMAYGTTTETVMTKSIGPFMRFYHPIGEKFFVFGQADYTYASADWKYNALDFGSNANVTLKSTSKGNILAVRPGLSYFITKRLAAEVILGSISYSKTDCKVGHQNGFDFKFITRVFSTGITFAL